MSAIEAEGARAASTELSRDLGLFDITMVGVAAMIGAGIFVLTGIAAGEAGPALIVAFALNGIVTLLTAMVYAELGSAMPQAGGGYVWVRYGLPGGSAFMAGWMDWFGHAVAGSLYALGFGSYFVETLQELGIADFGIPHVVLTKGMAVIIALLFIYINFKGASETGTIGNIVTVGKIAIIGVFVISGLVAIFGDPSKLQSFVPFAPRGIGGIIGAMGLTYIAYEGYEVIVQTGEEVKAPRRNIPKAIFLALLTVVPIYMLVAFTSIGAVDTGDATPTWQWLGQYKELGLLRAAEQFMPLGSVLLLVGALFSTMSALNATTYSSTRVCFALGRDRNLPPILGSVHPRTRTPYVALAVSGALIIGMAVGIPEIHDVAAAADIMFLLLFMAVNVAAITIRRKYGDKLHYGYLIPFFPYLPIVAIALQLFLAVFLFKVSAIAWYVTIGWLAAGALIYRFYASQKEREEKATPVLVEERLSIDRERFSVLVPVANPQHVDNLLAVARSVLSTQPGELILLHVITVPDQLPVSVGHEFVEEARPLMAESVRKAEAMGMTPNALIRVGHRPADAIMDTVIEQDADLVVMGWRGQSRHPRTTIGHNIERIVKDTHTDVVVVRGDVQLPARRILIPVINAERGRRVAELAASLSTDEDACIELLHVAGAELTPRQRADEASQMKEAISALDAQVRQESEDGRRKRRFHIRIETGDVVERIVERSRNFDLVMMGATQESWIRRQVWGDKVARVAAEAHCPLMLVNLREGRLRYRVSSFFEFFWDTDDEME
ncbi:MAG: amino acid permease [Armatimonadetes bacterium]|nr:amino acid permease [Armatimonadota bacterium]